MIDKQSLAVNFWSRYIITNGDFNSFAERTFRTQEALNTYFSSMEEKFVSIHSKKFINFLENLLGPVSFNVHIAMKVFPETHIYLNGREIKL